MHQNTEQFKNLLKCFLTFKSIKMFKLMPYLKNGNRNIYPILKENKGK